MTEKCRREALAHTWSALAERQAVLAGFWNPLRTVKDRHLTALCPPNLARGQDLHGLHVPLAAWAAPKRCLGRRPRCVCWRRDRQQRPAEPVSYTHLTLPTILRV